MERRTFQLIDLDRTLFDTSRFAKAITDEINLSEPGVGTKLNAMFEEAYKNEETFFMLRYLRQEHGDAWFEALVLKAVAKIGAATLLLTGVKERLALADSATSYRPSWGILTYGDDIDQRMKTRLVGLDDAPILLTSTPDKAKLIQSWQNPDGTFQLPSEFGGGIVDALTFEDDKLRAFAGLPKGVTGFWVTQDVHAVEKLAELHNTEGLVMPVKNLFEVANKLRQ